MRQAHNLVHVVDGAYGIGGPSDGDHAGVATNLRREIEHINRAIARLNIRRAHLHTAFFQTDPRRDIGVMVKAADQQFIAALQFPTESATQGERQRRHVGAEDHFVASQLKKSAIAARASAITCSVRWLVSESTTGICIAGGKVAGNRIDHPLRHLRATRGIEKRCRLSVHRLMQRRKLLTNPFHIQLAGRHSSSCARRHNQELLTAVRKSASKP